MRPPVAGGNAQIHTGTTRAARARAFVKSVVVACAALGAHDPRWRAHSQLYPAEVRFIAAVCVVHNTVAYHWLGDDLGLSVAHNDMANVARQTRCALGQGEAQFSPHLLQPYQPRADCSESYWRPAALVGRWCWHY